MWPESHRCAARNLLQTPAIVHVPRRVPLMSVQISFLPQLVMDLLKPSLVSFEVSRKNLVGEKINLFSGLCLLLKIRLSSCNAIWSLQLWQVPLLQPVGLFSEVCILESQQQQQKQLPTSWEYLPWNLNYCVKLLLSGLRFVFAKEICPTTTSREEKKEEKGLYITELTELLQ